VKKLLISVLLVLCAVIGLASPVAADQRVVASGLFLATVDFGSVAVHDAPGGNCLLTVDGVLDFTGALAGTASGTTTALVFGPCSEVAVSPPGTFADVFTFAGRYAGTAAGRPASGPLSYSGVTRVGGAISALITLQGPRSALLRANATVAVGGTYRGFVHA